MHNPKVGGSSVRAVLEKYRDPDVDLFGIDPEPTSSLHRIDRAHMGIDEFSRFFPDVWQETKSLPYFVLYRDPFKRFLSSINEYCRVYGATDIRFAALPERRRVFLELTERLDRLGRAEAVMDALDLTHFRPQWIYMQPPEGISLRLRAFDLKDMEEFTTELSLCLGAQLDFSRENSSEQFDIPGPLQVVLANNSIKKQLRRLPGATWAMGQLRKRSSGTAQSDRQLSATGRYGLTEAEAQTAESFVARFYARDFAFLEGLSVTPAAVEA